LIEWNAGRLQIAVTPNSFYSFSAHYLVGLLQVIGCQKQEEELQQKKPPLTMIGYHYEYDTDPFAYGA
jgi:hypothetical protein